MKHLKEFDSYGGDNPEKTMHVFATFGVPVYSDPTNVKERINFSFKAKTNSPGLDNISSTYALEKIQAGDFSIHQDLKEKLGAFRSRQQERLEKLFTKDNLTSWALQHTSFNKFIKDIQDRFANEIFSACKDRFPKMSKEKILGDIKMNTGITEG